MDDALAARIDEVAERARAAGALVPIETDFERVSDGGVDFVVRVAPSLAEKDVAATRAALKRSRAPDFDPFLPFDPTLWVADVPPHHVALLNKFCVLERHLLIVTRAFEEQQAPLTRADFAAWWWGLGQLGGLGFYNSGRLAGASQRHKHMQLVPPRLAPGAGVPIEAALVGLDRTWRPVAELPFEHVATALDDSQVAAPAEAASVTFDRYVEGVELLGLGDPSSASLAPYDLLVTRRWMLLVPRRAEHFEGLEVNALGYAGGLLARRAEQLDRLREVGPMYVLSALAGPKSV